jgi:hypothetical protein
MLHLRTSLLAAAGLAAAPALVAFHALEQDPAAPLDFAGLKQMVAGMGYEMNDLSETKMEVSVTRDTWDIPVAFEISGSTRYVWLTAYLGDVPEDGLPGSQANDLLRKNFTIQPAHFYITEKGALMIALALENRAVEPAMLRRVMEKVASDVADNSDTWSME